MKIAEFIKTQKETLPPALAAIIINDESVWSNNACYGYEIEAMKKCRLQHRANIGASALPAQRF